MRNDCDRAAIAFQLGDGQADPLDADGAFGNSVAFNFRRNLDPQPPVFRITNAPFFIRESDVLAHVSGARSAENDLAFISRAVRHTPLTAMLSPVCISVGACFASTVMWRFSSRCSMRTTRPTSSMMPVNIGNAVEPSAVRIALSASTNER